MAACHVLHHLQCVITRYWCWKITDVLGGSLSSYTDSERGNWIWSPGVQWVCDYSGNSVDYKLLKAITGGKVSFSPLDDECQIKYFTGEEFLHRDSPP